LEAGFAIDDATVLIARALEPIRSTVEPGGH